MTQKTKRTKVLDHGYVELVESWGSDEAIVCAARMSTGKGFKGWGPRCVECGRYVGAGCRTDVIGDGAPEDCKCDDPSLATKPGDEKLLAYLWKMKHSTPFEMAGMTVEVKAPIFVFRQWHRHRTFSFNEASARYTPLPDENYLPSVERLMVKSTKNKQAGTARGSRELCMEDAEFFRDRLARMYEKDEQLYQDALAYGIPKELARIHLPVARYSKMRASANLRNWLAFMTLRMDAHAQYEIRVYAEAVAEFIAAKFPRTWALFAEGCDGAC